MAPNNTELYDKNIFMMNYIATKLSTTYGGQLATKKGDLRIPARNTTEQRHS